MRRLVLVEWLDSGGCPGEWQELGDNEPEPVLTVHSVGWLTHKSAQCLTVTPHISDPDPGEKPQVRGRMDIPACAVIRIIDLEVPE